ncbi:pyridoxal phosphate-dependent aminotransferase [Dubosiella newyorkensis]|jgi:LL-diaminopimelate aminotransferase|uniref:pyridoxal phosphate-dependent aminotransferase n=1 Tax=Dubosiella newyorkensis TaxID=1862672 RepID=UPI0030811485
MIETAQRMRSFHTSVFTDLHALKQEYEQKSGKSALDFSLGSPNIAPESSIMDVLSKAVLVPKNYRYAINPLPSMIKAIQDWYQKRYDVFLESDEIALLQGSQEALINIPLIFCDPLDGVLVPDPYYPAYIDAPKLAGATILYMPLRKENEYLIDFDQISENDRKNAKIMIVCYPNNPTGAIAPDSFYTRLIQFAKENDILVLYDNAYSELVFEGKPGKSFLSFPGAKEVGVELNSFSKTYGMAGARLGVLVGNKDVIHQYKILKSNMDYGVFLPIQYAGIQALKHGGASIVKTREEYERRRDLLIQRFANSGWTIPKSAATMFLWAPIPACYENSLEFSKQLLKQCGIIVTPGLSFGKEGERYVRIALVVNEEQIEEAAKRIQEARSSLF